MRIVVNDRLFLSEFESSDKKALVEHLNDKDVSVRTLRIPFPYTEGDADAWFGLVARTTREQGRPVQWAIRDVEAGLIGSLGFHDFQLGKSHRAEMGYALGKPYWGQGIMTAVVRRACRLAFEEFGLAKITASVFTNNPASARVLAKCGFEQEGLLRKHFCKDGAFIDAWVFGLVKVV